MEKSMSTFYSHATTTTILIILLILATTSSSSSNPTSSPLHFSKSFRSSPSQSSPSVANPEKLFDDTIQSILTQLAQSTRTMASQLVTASTSSLQNSTEDDPEITSTTTGPVGDCMDLLDDTLDQLSNVAHRRHNPRAHTHDDVQTWLSAALTNQETCKESLQTPPLKNPHRHHEPMKAMLLQSLARNMTATVEASLALYVNHIRTNNSPRHVMSPKYRKYPSNNIPGGRKLLSAASSSFPGWLPAAKRKLLEASVGELEVHAVVVKDGSGTHTTIAAALRAVTMSGGATMASGGGGSSVIYIKAGTYKETLNIPTKQKNVVLMGDGKGKTVIVGSKNADDGSTTYQTATVGKTLKETRYII
ncbi:unnamed protein product [Linum trigynum]|uniref:Pectinesterase n=1 Tax=Linum trigynum TaxID=586398 RepID=A0AAV2D633_9ROSI